MCARRSRQVWGVGAGAGACLCPWAPPCPRVPRGACCGLSCPGVPSLRQPVRHSMRARFGCPLGPRRVPVACVCARAPAAYAPPPPLRVGVARALHAVLVQGAGRAVPGGWCPSAFPAPVPCSASLALGRVARSLQPLALLGVARPPAVRRALVRWISVLWGRHEGARRGAPFAWVWGARGWALPHARPAVLGACGRGLLPTGCGCGGGGRADPSPAPHRALLRAGFMVFIGPLGVFIGP